MVKECLWEEKKYNSSSSSWLFMLGQLFRDSSPDNRRDLSGIPSHLQNGTSGSGSVLSIESNLIIARALSKIWLWKEQSWVRSIESGHKVTLVQNFCSYFTSINRTIFPDTCDKIKFNDHQLISMFASTTVQQGFFQPPYAAAGNRTHVSQVAPLWEAF